MLSLYRSFFIICTIFFLSSLHGEEPKNPRIHKYPELFASYPTQIQKNIKKGQIEVGYTLAMVYLAIGAPSEMLEKEDKNIWNYWKEFPLKRLIPGLENLHSTHKPINGNELRPLKEGFSWEMPDPVKYLSIKIEFQKGKVSNIEYYDFKK